MSRAQSVSLYCYILWVYVLEANEVSLRFLHRVTADWVFALCLSQPGIVQGGYALMHYFLRNGLNASGFLNMTLRLNVFQKFPQGRRRYQILRLLGFLASGGFLPFLMVFDFGN